MLPAETKQSEVSLSDSSKISSKVVISQSEFPQRRFHFTISCVEKHEAHLKPGLSDKPRLADNIGADGGRIRSERREEFTRRRGREKRRARDEGVVKRDGGRRQEAEDAAVQTRWRFMTLRLYAGFTSAAHFLGFALRNVSSGKKEGGKERRRRLFTVVPDEIHSCRRIEIVSARAYRCRAERRA
ncbi:hypothetical protein EYF80_054789 [Liparis tanakae]|uniref:Uncharacterized protein n=1 Tax=Liparis tanakae TaxID=230148 RepID=A0A4Z2F2D9_9TELE|nr:hypothetical protein EYF80_054789 [Liparis tanakae]